MAARPTRTDRSATDAVIGLTIAVALPLSVLLWAIFWPAPQAGNADDENADVETERRPWDHSGDSPDP